MDIKLHLFLLTNASIRPLKENIIMFFDSCHRAADNNSTKKEKKDNPDETKRKKKT